MAAFRFLALITVGFVLLMLVFLLNASQARLEREGLRVLTGPSFQVAKGAGGAWIIDLGASRIEESWPGAQRQPSLFVRGAGGADIAARAEYLGDDDVVLLDAFVQGERVVGAIDPASGDLNFGPLWLSWEHPLRITFEVLGSGDVAEDDATPVLRGTPSKNYVAARAVARTLWIVFTILGALGFAGLVATQKELFGVRIGSPTPDRDA